MTCTGRESNCTAGVPQSNTDNETTQRGRNGQAPPKSASRVRQCCPVSRLRTTSTRCCAGPAALALAAIVMLGAGCGNDDAPSAERFCGEVAKNTEALTSPQLTDAADIEILLELYREIGDLAPLSVEDDWNQLVSAYETASTVVIGDQESEQAALTAIYSSEQSAAQVEAWLMANCAVDIGPVFTIVPQGPAAITVPPAATTTSAP